MAKLAGLKPGLKGVYGKKAKLAKICQDIKASMPKQKWGHKAKLVKICQDMQAWQAKQRFGEAWMAEDKVKTELKADIRWLRAEIWKAMFRRPFAPMSDGYWQYHHSLWQQQSDKLV